MKIIKYNETEITENKFIQKLKWNIDCKNKKHSFELQKVKKRKNPRMAEFVWPVFNWNLNLVPEIVWNIHIAM